MFSEAIVTVGQRETDRDENHAVRLYAEQRARLDAVAPVVAEAVRHAESLARLETALSRMR